MVEELSAGIVAGALKEVESLNALERRLETGGVIVGEAKTDRRLTKARYLELVQIASQVVDMLRVNGVKQHEGCQINKLAGQMWEMP